MRHYDFIVFENYKLAKHHIYDVELIARMLRSQGIQVAIFDLYHQYKLNNIEGIPIIHWDPIHCVPNDDWMLRRHTKWETVYKSVRFWWQQREYIREAKAYIQDMADSFYCGSYHNGMSTVFFDLPKNCYWWGLRSERMRFSWRKFLNRPLLGFNILRERIKFLRNPQQRLFVSNEIILKEYERLGVLRNRMVIREERCVETIDDANLNSITPNISFLVIGMLRPSKHIPETIQAFKKASICNSSLKLIGRSTSNYEEVIERSIDSDNRILRKNTFLEYADFNEAFRESHFVLFADEEGECCITNGTMMEALINHRPIICPNYNPYKYYVEKYQIGILYEKGNIQSYVEALKKATDLGVASFIPAIDKFLYTIQFDNVAKNFVEDIKRVQYGEI